MIPTNYADLLRLVLPEGMVVLTAFLVLAVDLLWQREAPTRKRFLTGTILACTGCIAAIARLWLSPQQANLASGMLAINPQSQLVQTVLLFLAALILLLAIDSTFTVHVGEYLALILFATASMMFLVASQNILLIFLSLELLSLSLYTLTAFDKRSARSAEAALKYFLFGGMSAAFMLFGLSLVYGLSNSLDLAVIGRTLQESPLDPLLNVAMVMVVIGFGFKVAAVAFHFWAPDVYQSAPASSASLIASAAKVAGLVIFYQVMVLGFAGAQGIQSWQSHVPGWGQIIALLAAASMLLGNLVALRQTSVRRLLAYSAIAHVGYMLLALLAHSTQSFAALLYYAFTYALTTVGAFAVVAVVETHAGSDQLADFAGLSRRAPLLSVCMMVFLLSLAGIPPLAGFFAKFYLFASALTTPPHPFALLWLVILAIAMSAVSLYYYLQVLKRIFIADPPPDASPIRAPLLSQVLISLIALAVLILGCAPNLLLAPILQALHAMPS